MEVGKGDSFGNPIFWSGEEKIELLLPNNVSYVEGENRRSIIQEKTSSIFKQSGGRMTLWGCFRASSTGELIKVDGMMRKHRHVSRRHTLQSCRITYAHLSAAST